MYVCGLDVYVHACAVCHAFVCILGPQEDQEPGVGVVAVPVPMGGPSVVPTGVPVSASPIPSVSSTKFSTKKPGDKSSRDKKREVCMCDHQKT